MTTPTNHHVRVTNRAGNVITAGVVRVKDLGSGCAGDLSVAQIF